jgi:DUF4097 and DUF4098 domain-containing protein YvlB
MLLLLAVLTTAAFQDTDTTIAVRAGSRLNLDNFDGAVTVTTWNKSSLRVQASHDEDTRVEVDVRGTTVGVRGRSRYGPPEVEYRLTVPADMSLEINTHSGDVEIDGTRGEVQVQTVEGRITVSGGTGRVSLSSVEGEVLLSNASGRINISAVDGSVTVRGAKGGDLQVSAVDGAVILQDLDLDGVEASTVDGEIDFSGQIREAGRYRLSSHDGDVTVTVPSLDAAVTVSTYDGEFESDFEVTLTNTRTRKRLDFTLGRGSARLELESFDGNVRLRKSSGRRP